MAGPHNPGHRVAYSGYYLLIPLVHSFRLDSPQWRSFCPTFTSRRSLFPVQTKNKLLRQNTIKWRRRPATTLSMWRMSHRFRMEVIRCFCSGWAISVAKTSDRIERRELGSDSQWSVRFVGRNHSGKKEVPRHSKGDDGFGIGEEGAKWTP